MSQTESIVFFGTGPVSLATLEAISGYFNVEAVITRPSNQTRVKGPLAPVKQWANERSVHLYEPTDKKALLSQFKQADFTSKVGLVVDYGLILPKELLDFFPQGIINSHFSLLPKLRGADPITFAILEGAAITGVSLMKIVPHLDEGNLIAQSEYKMPAGITITMLTTDLTQLSNKLLIKKLPEYIAGKIIPYPQDQSIQPTYSRRLVKADGRIDWQKSAIQIEREIRAYLGWPSSYTAMAGKEVKILDAQVVKYGAKQPGLVCVVEDQLHVETGQDSLRIVKLQVAGKNPISGAEFVRGYIRK